MKTKAKPSRKKGKGAVKCCATSLNMAHFLKINRVTLSQPRDDSQTNHPIPILKNIFAYLADSFHR